MAIHSHGTPSVHFDLDNNDTVDHDMKVLIQRLGANLVTLTSIVGLENAVEVAQLSPLHMVIIQGETNIDMATIVKRRFFNTPIVILPESVLAKEKKIISNSRRAYFFVSRRT